MLEWRRSNQASPYTSDSPTYRRLAYDLDRFWEDNDVELQKLFRAFRVAALGLSAEIVILIAMVSDYLF